jgi:glycosyltransferase involved in cell wall biosynthesis
VSSPSRLNVVFVNYHDFTSNSAIHIFHLANSLTSLGVDCTVCVPGSTSTVSAIGQPAFTMVDFESAGRGRIAFRDEAAPTLIHAWTPREIVRGLTEDLSRRYGWPYVVHLEDHEDAITAQTLGVSLDDLPFLAPRELERRLPETLSHPQRARTFLSNAVGVTVIVDRLLELTPSHLPAELVWPAYEKELFSPRPPDPELRRALKIAADERVVVYTGNAHASNAAELRSLYLAVNLVNERGSRTKLIRLGRDFVDFLGSDLRRLENHVIAVGYRPRRELPEYLALADVLVQPGRSSAFNDYRFPAKLPEYLAMGKPVVLPATNLGNYLEDGVDCLLLRRGDAIEIADAMERVFSDGDLAEQIGRRGRAFAEEHFDWRMSAAVLHRFYDRLTGRRGQPDDDAALMGIAERYARFATPRIGYATVRDYCDSADHLPLLASANNDMKDVQRPWMLKAVLGLVPPGGRLLEIGAGDPIVADMLSRVGYDVTVIDPYDGRDGGPAEFDALRAKYPTLRFLRGTFPEGMGSTAANAFDCIYSISVLEHIPDAAVRPVCDGIRRFSRTDAAGVSIHVMDHVLLGHGSAEHRAKLAAFAREFGIDSGELDGVLSRLERDPETYFLSAEGHNRWRGAVPYDAFPMRRCVSMHFAVQVGSDGVKVHGA